MEDRDAPVFVVAPANQIADLPPELLRRGRFDELFFVDLPNWHERKQIFGIHLRKRGWKPEKYDLEALASITEGFSGAEIEQVVVSALYTAFNTGIPLGTELLLTETRATSPLSVVMAERVQALRSWAAGRTVSAN
jgi:SpoVK/Ycf46/Vps4 family AAA+-type ATPase